MLGDRGEHLVLVLAAGQVDHPGAGVEHRPDHRRPVGLDRHDRVPGQLLDDRQQLLELLVGADPVGGVAAGLGAEVDDPRALLDLHPALADGRLGRPGDALAVGRVAGEVDDAHQRRQPVLEHQVVADPDRGHRTGQVVGVLLVESGEVGEGDHASESRVGSCESCSAPTYPSTSCTPPRSGPWLRVNMVSTVDGAATGGSGTSRSINNAIDQVVFNLLRQHADVLVVGAGTLRTEAYAPNPLPIVVVTRSGAVPPTLADCPPGQVLVATCSHAPRIAEAREVVGDEHVLVLGSHRVDLAALREQLVERGFRRILSEGGPHLLRDLLDQGCVDEIDSTIVPRLIGGTHPRILDGPPVDVPLRLHSLLEQDGTLLARWLVDR